MSQKFFAYASALFFTATLQSSPVSALSLFSNSRTEVERYLKIIEMKEKRNTLVKQVQEASKNPEIVKAHQEANKLQRDLEIKQANIEELKNNAQKQINQAIRFLEDQMQRKKEDRKGIEELILPLKSTSNTITKLDKYLGSYLGIFSTMSKKLAYTIQEGVQLNLQGMDRQIEDLKASIDQEQANLEKSLDAKFVADRLKGIFGGGKTIRDSILAISKNVEAIKRDLQPILDKLISLQKSLVIDTYSKQSVDLIADLTKAVKDAKCPLIKSIGSLSDDNIKECMRLSLNKVSKITEYNACTKLKKTEGRKITLIPGATYNQILKCAQDYTATKKK